MGAAQVSKAAPAICNEGCGEQFEVKGFQTARLPGAVEKTFFTCPHCLHEYIAFYTDLEVRQLQDKIRRIQSQIQSPRVNQAVIMKKIKKTQADIKAGMDRVRAAVEGGTG